MQFYLNGFRPGDPEVFDASDRAMSQSSATLPEQVDVLIIGSGPAGLTLAAQLAAFPEIHTCIIDVKSGPLKVGQADGIACRSMEMFEAFGFSERVMKEGYWVNETTFWKPDPMNPDHIARSGRVQDVEEGLSEFPHMILNQARVHDFFLAQMLNSPSRLAPHYSHQLVSLTTEPENDPYYPVVVTVDYKDVNGEPQRRNVKARYVVGCDGARSSVRQMIGQRLRGDSANVAWGVMDALAVTDFPDIRYKCLIQSRHEGSVLIIPREGGYLFRVYVELDQLNENERVSSRNISADQIIAAANRVLRPYSLDVKEIPWWSVYEIGQRLCDRFDDVPLRRVDEQLPRVFIAGDACHTHSPKAGQGMNVSMRDSFNLGWKLAGVITGRYKPEILHTYNSERHAVAKELIDFDREWAAVLSAGSDSRSADTDAPDATKAEFQSYFIRSGRYTAGTSIRYAPSLVCGDNDYSAIAAGFCVGERFHSALVTRLADAKTVHLGHTVKADGRWRLFIFAGESDTGSDKLSQVRTLCDYLANDSKSPIRMYTRKIHDIDSVIDVRAVFQASHRDLSLETMPALLLPGKGRYGLIDYEKVFCSNLTHGHDIYTLRGINRESGCLVLVRPDQHIALILPSNAYSVVGRFFERFFNPLDSVV